MIIMVAKILLLPLDGGALAYMWFGLANSLTALFVARAFSGTIASNIAAAQAYLADISNPKDRTTAPLVFLLKEPRSRDKRRKSRANYAQLNSTAFRNGIPGIIVLNFLFTISFTMLMALFPLWGQAQTS